MSFNFHVDFSRTKTSLLLASIFLGALVAGCGERPGEVAKTESTNLCANPGAATSLFASKYDPATKQGWYVNGPAFAEQKKDVPMGRFDNQIAVELPVLAGTSAARVKLQVSGTVPTAGIILDTIWYSGSNEVGRSSPSMELGKTLSNVIDTTQTAPAGADRLQLIARPWRDIDGILTVGGGEIVWCKK
jgi:hypothetical protein